MILSKTCWQLLIPRGTTRLSWIVGSQVAHVSSATSTRSSPSDRASSSNTNTHMNYGSSSLVEKKQQLAKAAILQVPQYGWTQDAITAAVVEKKWPISLSGLWTPSDLVNWLMDDFNEQLKNKQQHGEEENNNNAVLDKIKWRLEQVIPLVESGQWQAGMAMGMTHTPLKTRAQLHEFIQLVAPPGSSMFYQTGLGAIFIATELHLLSDKSQGYNDTWDFLRQRLVELEHGNILDNNIIGSTIPMSAVAAVGTSFLEGAASLLFPPLPNSNQNSKNNSFHAVPGTRASDYYSPHDEKTSK